MVQYEPKEYLGIAFGDSIEQYPQTLDGRKWLRVIPVLKKFQYYRIAVGDYLVLYCVIGKVMEVRRFVYAPSDWRLMI